MKNSSEFDPNSKKTGVFHIIAATSYSISGFKYLVQEAAFRHELILGAALMVTYLALGVSLQNMLIGVCLILITFAAEALNTAIEMIIDKTSPEISDYAKHTKNLGSFAVMCLLIANGIFGIYAITSTF